jgi:hypothetical protein
MKMAIVAITQTNTVTRLGFILFMPETEIACTRFAGFVCRLKQKLSGGKTTRNRHDIILCTWFLRRVSSRASITLAARNQTYVANTDVLAVKKADENILFGVGARLEIWITGILS